MIRRATYENIGRALAYIRADITRSPLEAIPLPTAVEEKVAFNTLPNSVRMLFGISIAAAKRVEQYIETSGPRRRGADGQWFYTPLPTFAITR